MKGLLVPALVAAIPSVSQDHPGTEDQPSNRRETGGRGSEKREGGEKEEANVAVIEL